MVKGISLVVRGSGGMQALGGRLAKRLAGSAACVTLTGELGAGKTTLVRAVLRGLGHTGVVRSPTYTLMEEYPLQQLVLHLDLYRLSDPEELDYLGLRDALADDPLIFVEWPERGEGMLPKVDIAICIEYMDSPPVDGQSEVKAEIESESEADQARRVTLLPMSATGSRILDGGDWAVATPA